MSEDFQKEKKLVLKIENNNNIDVDDIEVKITRIDDNKGSNSGSQISNQISKLNTPSSLTQLDGKSTNTNLINVQNNNF